MQEYNIVDIANSFNKSIKQIINCIDMTITNNIMFDTMKRKVKIAIDANPLLLLQECLCCNFLLIKFVVCPTYTYGIFKSLQHIL